MSIEALCMCKANTPLVFLIQPHVGDVQMEKLSGSGFLPYDPDYLVTSYGKLMLFIFLSNRNVA